MLWLCLWALTAGPLPVDRPCHTQGMKMAGDALFVSCVDRAGRAAWLYRFAWPEVGAAPAQSVELSEGARYHPSGLDSDGQCLWVAVAEYRPRSSSRVLCLAPDTLQPQFRFEVSDHIGALAAMEERLVGFNWDSRKIYLWATSGRELDRGNSPFGTAYQDCKALDAKTMVCAGIKRRGRLLWRQSVLDWIATDSESVAGFRLLERRRLAGRTRIGHRWAREAMDISGETVYFIPDDFPGAEVYALPSPSSRR